MLRPSQFHVNEAWVAFKLNEVPVRAGADGDFDLIALMDAASCYLLASCLVASNLGEPTHLEARQLLLEGRAHKQQLPAQLYIPAEQPADHLAQEAERLGIAVTRVPQSQLLSIIGEVRREFQNRLGRR